MPGKVIVVSPTEIASEATTKNQPPDMDIIMFQIRPGIAKGASSCQNFCQAVRRKPLGDLVEIARHGAQRLIETEGHVPGLAGEDREDRRAFRAEHRAGEQAEEKGHGKGQEAEDRHRLQNVEQRDQNHFGAPAFGGERRIGEGEDERGRHRREHAQRRAQRVIGQIPVGQIDRGFAGRAPSPPSSRSSESWRRRRGASSRRASRASGKTSTCSRTSASRRSTSKSPTGSRRRTRNRGSGSTSSCRAPRETRATSSSTRIFTTYRHGGKETARVEDPERLLEVLSSYFGLSFPAGTRFERPQAERK